MNKQTASPLGQKLNEKIKAKQTVGKKMKKHKQKTEHQETHLISHTKWS